MHEFYSALPTSLSPSSHSPAMCCGAAHLWTLLNGALVWPDSSPLLHFPSNLPAQPSDCHRKAVKTFHSFCIAALFPLHCLTIAIFYRTARFVYLFCHLHFFPLCCLFINRLFLPTRCMSKPGFLSSQHNMSRLCYRRLNDSVSHSNVISSGPIIICSPVPSSKQCHIDCITCVKSKADPPMCFQTYTFSLFNIHEKPLHDFTVDLSPSTQGEFYLYTKM